MQAGTTHKGLLSALASLPAPIPFPVPPAGNSRLLGGALQGNDVEKAGERGFCKPRHPTQNPPWGLPAAPTGEVLGIRQLSKATHVCVSTEGHQQPGVSGSRARAGASPGLLRDSSGKRAARPGNPVTHHTLNKTQRVSSAARQIGRMRITLLNSSIFMLEYLPRDLLR